MDSIVIQTLTGDAKTKAKLLNEDNLNSEKPSNFTATFSDVNEVYSILPGRVLYIGVYKDMGTVSVMVSAYEMIRYLNIHDIKVINGESINERTHIGTAYKNTKFQLEYCSTWQGTSIYPVRLQNVTLFKQNPMPILNATYVPDYNRLVTQGYVEPDKVVELNEEQQAEFVDYPFTIPTIVENDKQQITSLANWTAEMAQELTNGRGPD